MKSIVFVKQVPDSTADLVVENGQVVWGDAPLVINPWDEIAVEAALLQIETYGGNVTAVSIGKTNETEALKYAMAMGCEEIILVSDPKLDGADSQVMAHVMGAVVKKFEDVKLVFFGRQAIDSETGVTAAQTARVLGWPILSLVSAILKMDMAKGLIIVERSTEEGKQIVEAQLPVVMTFGRDFGEPRFPSFIGKRKAARADIPVWGLDDLGLQGLSPVVQWFGVEDVPPEEIEIEMIVGESIQDIAGRLADRIQEARGV